MLNARIVTNRKPVTTNPTSILILAGALSACMAGAAAAQPFFAGDEDNFGNPDDFPNDTLVIRPLFDQWLARPGGQNDQLNGGVPRPFDIVPDHHNENWQFGYTFENLPTLNAGATLEIRLRAMSDSGFSYNDSINLQYTGDGDSSSFLWGTSIAALDGGAWDFGETAIFTLDLGNLGGLDITGDINTAGYLDVFMQDDTSVDWMRLTVPTPGTASLLALGGVMAMRRRR